MQTKLTESFLATPQGQVANEMLQKCTHCGMCTAVCPTFQLSGNELDSPRGRIYQIKQVLEGTIATPTVQQHLDRCLTCRACETVCPARVEYGKLVEIGRLAVEQQVGRTLMAAAKRYVVRKLMTTPQLFRPLYRAGQVVRPILPESLKSKVMPVQTGGCVPKSEHSRKVLMLEGCVQPSMSPNINYATQRVLDRLGIQTVLPSGAGCCGAVNLHLNAEHDALDNMRRNIDAWYPWLQKGVKTLVVNASGCGVMVKEYGYQLRNDPQYAEKAATVSRAVKDIVELLSVEVEQIKLLLRQRPSEKIAYHPPCTLQHGQRLSGSVEALFQALGFTVWLPENKHLCCGSAGTYSLFESEWSMLLKQNKQQTLEQLQPDIVLSANIGCIAHLAEGMGVPVCHWIEYLDEQMAEAV